MDENQTKKKKLYAYEFSHQISPVVAVFEHVCVVCLFVWLRSHVCNFTFHPSACLFLFSNLFNILPVAPPLPARALTFYGCQDDSGVVVRYHISIAVFGLVDLQVGMLPSELLPGVNGLGKRKQIVEKSARRRNVTVNLLMWNDSELHKADVFGNAPLNKS